MDQTATKIIPPLIRRRIDLPDYVLIAAKTFQFLDTDDVASNGGNIMKNKV